MSRKKDVKPQTAAEWLRFGCVLFGLVIGAWAADAMVEANPELAWVSWAGALALIGACVMRAFRHHET